MTDEQGSEALDTNIAALATLLASAGFRRVEGYTIVSYDSSVAVTCSTDGYHVSFPYGVDGLGVIDLPSGADIDMIGHITLALHTQAGAR